MSRKNTEHTAASLFALAEQLHGAAHQIEERAKKCRTARLKGSISVANQEPINKALVAVKMFCHDIDRKLLDLENEG